MGILKVNKKRAIDWTIAVLEDLKSKDELDLIDDKKFVDDIMAEFMVGNLTAKDYLRTARAVMRKN